jgi:hypothetical protein
MDPEQTGQSDGSAGSPQPWLVESLVVNVLVFPDEPGYVTQANLSDHIGKSKGGPHGGFMRGRKFYLADFHDNSQQYRKKTLLPALNDVCRGHGFQVVSDGYKKKEFGLLRIMCSCGVMYQGKAAAANLSSDDQKVDATEGVSVGGERRLVRRNVLGAKRKKGVTGRPVDKAERCRFAFSLFWDETYRLWYFYEYGAGWATHTGHSPSYPREGPVAADHSGGVTQPINTPTTATTTTTPPGPPPPGVGVMNDDDECRIDCASSQEQSARDNGNDDDAFPDAGGCYDDYDDDESVLTVLEEYGGRRARLSSRTLTLQGRATSQSQANVFNNSAGGVPPPLDALQPIVHELASYCTTPELLHECMDLLQSVKTEMRARHHHATGGSNGGGQP